MRHVDLLARGCFSRVRIYLEPLSSSWRLHVLVLVILIILNFLMVSFDAVLAQLSKTGRNYGLVFDPLVLKGLIYLLAVANRALILAADRFCIVLVFAFLLFLLATLLFNRLFPQSFFDRNISNVCIILTFLVHLIVLGVSCA